MELYQLFFFTFIIFLSVPAVQPRCPFTENTRRVRADDISLKDGIPDNMKIKTEMSGPTSRKYKSVGVTLFYETLCPYCVDFVSAQLLPAMTKLQDYITLHLVPYGNAKTIINRRHKYSFNCQHGPNECYGNKLHACAIDMLGDTGAIPFIGCLTKNSDPREEVTSITPFQRSLRWCGASLNMTDEVRKIVHCARQRHGSQLLREYGKETKAHGKNYVPYILFKMMNTTEEYVGNDLVKDICSKLEIPPPVCDSQYYTIY